MLVVSAFNSTGLGANDQSLFGGLENTVEK